MSAAAHGEDIYIAPKRNIKMSIILKLMSDRTTKREREKERFSPMASLLAVPM